MRYSVAVAVEVIDSPERAVGDSARDLGKLAELLPKGARLREAHLPDKTGMAELRVDLDAAGPADAVHMLNRAMELVVFYVGGLESLGPLHEASVVQLGEWDAAPPPSRP
jgi:hypothetical protein